MVLVNTFLECAILLLPMLGAGIFHGLVMKYRISPGLTTPIDGGRIWRGVRIFGDNKTWRGLIATGVGFALVQAIVVLAWRETAAFKAVYIQDWSVIIWVVFGFICGFVAMLGELPNSFMKRRMGVAPGQGAGGRNSALFYVVDQVDLLLFLFPIWAVMGALSLPRAAMILALVVVVHQVLSSVGYRLGMRKTPR